MENLIFGAFATLEGYREGDAANLGRGVYDRCTVVALCSAKARNPGCTVARVTNAPLPEPYAGQLAAAGVVFSGLSPDGRLVEAMELPGQPFYLGVQYHPEFKSRPDRPHPVFAAFVAEAGQRAQTP